MYLSPEKPWPPHSRPQAQAALVRARRAGWWFEATDHDFGRLRCVPPEHDPRREGCVVMVRSTSGPADGSTTARWILDALRKCPHGVPPVLRQPDPDGAAALATGELSKVEGLLDAAAGLRRESAERAESDRLLNRALEVLEENPAAAEALEERAVEQEQAARSSAARGLAGAARAGIQGGWPPEQGAEELFAAAREGLARVSEALDEMNPQAREAVASALSQLNERLERRANES